MVVAYAGLLKHEGCINAAHEFLEKDRGAGEQETIVFAINLLEQFVDVPQQAHRPQHFLAQSTAVDDAGAFFLQLNELAEHIHQNIKPGKILYLPECLLGVPGFVFQSHFAYGGRGVLAGTVQTTRHKSIERLDVLEFTFLSIVMAASADSFVDGLIECRSQ